MFIKYSEWIKLYEASAEELYSQFYSDIPYEYFIKIINSDPDPKKSPKGFGKATKWLLTAYRNTIKDKYRKIHHYFHWLDGVSEALVLYYKHKNILAEPDINKYEYYDFAFDINREISNMEFANSFKDIKKIIKDEETIIHFENDEWILLTPLTVRSSCFWGLGTRWCTAGKEENKFDNYNADAPIYIMLSKNLKDDSNKQLKFQLFFSKKSKEIFECVNNLDNYMFTGPHWDKIDNIVWKQLYKLVGDRIFELDSHGFILLNKNGLIDSRNLKIDKVLAEKSNIVYIADKPFLIICYLENNKMNVYNVSADKFIFESSDWVDIVLVKRSDGNYYFLYTGKNNGTYGDMSGRILYDGVLKNIKEFDDYIVNIVDLKNRKNILNFSGNLLLKKWVSDKYSLVYIDENDFYLVDKETNKKVLIPQSNINTNFVHL